MKLSSRLVQTSFYACVSTGINKTHSSISKSCSIVEPRYRPHLLSADVNACNTDIIKCQALLQNDASLGTFRDMVHVAGALPIPMLRKEMLGSYQQSFKIKFLVYLYMQNCGAVRLQLLPDVCLTKLFYFRGTGTCSCNRSWGLQKLSGTSSMLTRRYEGQKFEIKCANPIGCILLSVYCGVKHMNKEFATIYQRPACSIRPTWEIALAPKKYILLSTTPNPMH